MINDSFKIRFKALPIAISEQTDSAATPLHNHNEFEIISISDGSCKIRAGCEEFYAKKGDIVFINPMEVHEVSECDKSSYHHKCICFDTSIISGSLSTLKNELSSITHHIENNKHSQYLKGLFDKAFDAAKADEKTSSMDITAYLTLTFSYLIKNSLTNSCVENCKENSFSKDALRYIQNHYMEKITSSQAATECFLNHSHFCRKFKENFGISFSSYLNMYRISVSKGLLEESDKSIASIAQLCGFESSAYFSKCFKELVGISPAEYKNAK